MKAQFDHSLISSFYLWFERELLSDKIAAYTTGLDNVFQYHPEANLPDGFISYQGSYRQLVADQDVSVPNSGIFVNSSFVTGAASGLYLDYNDGRVIMPAASGTTLNITANSTVKEVNTYMTNDDVEKILMEYDFIVDGQSQPDSASRDSDKDEKSYFLPACFVIPSQSNNKVFAFGGEEDTRTSITVMVLTDNNFVMDGVLNHFRDRSRTCVPIIDFNDFPYGDSFTVKSFPYEYNALASTASSDSMIETVNASRVTEKLNNKLNKGFQIGFLNFELSTYRFPRL
ncbi:hypothetical protein N9955_00805 [bacterium]|nr:hypothetical protein [bacterium]